MSAKPKTSEAKLLQRRIGLTVYLLSICGAFFIIMIVIAPRLTKWRDEDTQFYTCEQVVAGDLIRLSPMGAKTNFVVRIEGIMAPPLDRKYQLAFADALGVSDEHVPELARISRNALSTLILKHSNLLIMYDPDKPRYDAEGHLITGVSMSKVDLGKIQVREGQAMVRDGEHPLQPYYKELETAARTKKIGIWRPLK